MWQIQQGMATVHRRKISGGYTFFVNRIDSVRDFCCRMRNGDVCFYAHGVPLTGGDLK
jgi:hypothetical protein